jgi:hypothetical protein
VQHLVTIAKNKWASDPKFAARSDQVLFKNYLDARNAIHNELQAREVHGIDNDANRDLAATWTQYTAYLRQSDPAFEQIFNRVLESDDLSRELL